ARAWAWLWMSGASYALVLVALIGMYMADVENDRSPKQFARALTNYVQESGVPIARLHLPEEASVYLPLDIPAATPASPRVVIVVDDNRREIERGKLKPDETFFAPLTDNEPILSIERIPLNADDGHGRWKAYVLTFDRGRADGG